MTPEIEKRLGEIAALWLTPRGPIGTDCRHGEEWDLCDACRYDRECAVVNDIPFLLSLVREVEREMLEHIATLAESWSEPAVKDFGDEIRALIEKEGE